MPFLSSDPTLLATGVILLVLGSILAMLRTVPYKIYHWVKSRFLFTIEIPHGSPLFSAIILWLNEHPSNAKAKSLIAYVEKRYNEYSDGVEADEEISYTPEGNHFLKYGNKWFWFNRNREKQANNGMFVGMYETINITTLGRRRGSIEKIIKEAHDLALERKRGKVIVHALNQYGTWEETSYRKPRPLASVIMPQDVIDATYNDLRKFQEAEDWYTNVGIPYRRGYLLYGPPGNGKTSLVFAIASELKHNLAIFNLSSITLTDQELIIAFGNVPKDCFVLIEDIDSAFNQREKMNDGMRITFSGLLNALDGVASAEGRVLFMTTNHKEHLDPALIRPSRIDKQVFIDNAQPDEARRMYLKFFPGQEKEAKEFASALQPNTSMATLQEHFLSNKNA